MAILFLRPEQNKKASFVEADIRDF